MSLDATVRQLLACVCDGLTLPPCRCYGTAGEPVIDECCECADSVAGPGVAGEGELTVSLVEVYDAEVGPDGISPVTPVHPCRNGPRAADVIVSLSRCHPTLDDSGDPPDPTALDAAATQIHQDVTEMWRLLACCDIELTITRIGTIRGPEGGCVVAVAEVTILWEEGA